MRPSLVAAIGATILALGVAVIAAITTLSASEAPPAPMTVVDVDSPRPSPTASRTASPTSSADDHVDDDHEGQDDDD